MAKVNASGYQDSDRSSWKWKHLNANATTVVKAAPGLLHAIMINTKGASANTITVYDNATGTTNVIAAIDPVNAIPGSVILIDAECVNGITVVIATGTAADITVLYA